MLSSLRLTLVVSLLFPTFTSAQQGTADLRGQVLDQQGAVLPGVTVVARDQDTGNFRETVSNSDGTFSISGVRPGRYEIAAELGGFQKYVRRDLLLEVGKTQTIDVEMQVGALSEVLTVIAEAPVIDVTSKEIGGNITSRELTELPSINRNYIGFVGLLPGIIPTISTESFGSDAINVNGQDARNNNYMLDGASNNDDAIGQRAGTQARTPLESIQEFQVITNQFDAEFGRTTGAVINAVTKQGTNRVRGSAFYYMQDAGITAVDYFTERNGLAKPDTARREFGGTVGGPVVRDRVHFFGSLERVLIDEGVTVNIPEAPQANATTTEQTRVWNTIVRLDHQVNANNTYGVRWLREYSPQFNQVIESNNLPVTLAASREEDDLDQTVVGSLSSVLGANTVNAFRVSWTQEDVSFSNPGFNGNGRNQAALPPTLQYLSFVDQQSPTAEDRVNDAYQLEDTLSWFIPDFGGSHDLKSGVQYQFVQVVGTAQGNLNGTFQFGRSNAAFDPANPFTYPDRLSVRVPGVGRSVVKAHYLSGFAQDKWQVAPRVTLNLGARYDLEILKSPGVNVPEIGLVGDAPVDGNNFQPRVGFSFDLNGDGRSVARGGYGLFYDKTHFDLGVTGLFTAGRFSDSFTVNFPLNAADPGPRNGQLPTDPLLVGGPTLNRALLAQLFPAGTLQRNTGTVNLDNPDRVVPYTHQISLGYERQLAPNISASVDYVRSMARDLFMTRDLNPGLRPLPVPTSSLVRTNSAVFAAAVNQLVNEGETDYDSLMFSLEKRYSRGFSVRGAYTLSYSRGNTSGVGAPTSIFQVLDDLQLDRNQGPTNFDRRHNLVVSGTTLVPRTGGMTFSWVARALSGSPFNIFNSDIDPDRNGNINEPLAAGSYAGNGLDAYSVEAEQERNGAYGPGFFQLDIRVGYRLRIGAERTLDIFGEAFNLTNRVNFGNPPGNIVQPSFLLLTTYRDGAVPRTGQFGVRLGF